jgi:hypothetical protein
MATGGREGERVGRDMAKEGREGENKAGGRITRGHCPVPPRRDDTRDVMRGHHLVAEAGQALGRGLGLVVQGRARGAQLIELPQVLQKQR